MSVKIKNLEIFWREEGFEIIRNYITERRGDVFEIRVVFKRLDEKPTEYVDEWFKIKRVADRQGFYAMPIHVGIPEGSNIKRVLLVKKRSIIDAVAHWQGLVPLLEQSYWGMQGDVEVIGLTKKAQSLAISNVGLHQEVKALHSSTPSKAPSSTLLNQNDTHSKWLSVKGRTLDFCKEIQELEKAPEQVKELAKELEGLFER